MFVAQVVVSSERNNRVATGYGLLTSPTLSLLKWNFEVREAG